MICPATALPLFAVLFALVSSSVLTAQSVAIAPRAHHALDARWLRAAGVRFRNDIISGPGGKQVVLDDPSGNPIELFQPAGRG